MLMNYNIKIYNGELEILNAGEYWYNKSTRELKEGDGISAYNELAVLGKIEDCVRELIPENFGVKSYITEVEALENADLDSEINIQLLNEIIEIATISCLPISFNKRYYCINNSIIISPQNLSSPQATSENVIMNGNGATLIIGTNMPAILVKSCANTISDFNLTFNKNIFDSINGRMYFENQKYLGLEKNYYTNSLFKIESGYAKTLAQSNRVINIDAYNPNFWGCGVSDSTYYLEDVLTGAGFEINLNEAKSYSYLNIFENCKANLLGTAIKLTHSGAAINNNLQINANTFNIDSWGCDKYLEGTGGGSYYNGNVQSNKLKVKYIDENGEDVLAKRPYSNPLDFAIWNDENGKQVYSKIEDGRWIWTDENGVQVKRSVSSGKVRWKDVKTSTIKYTGNISLYAIPEIDLYPYRIVDALNEITGTEIQIDDDGIIMICGTNSETEIINYKNLTLPAGKYSFVYENYMEGNPVGDQTYSNYWIEVNGNRYQTNEIFELTENSQVAFYVEFYNFMVSMSYGNNFQIWFKPRLFKEVNDPEIFKLQKTNEYLINEVGGNIGTSIFNNMFYDIETSSDQSDEKILKQNGSNKYPIMNQRLVNIKGSGNHFVRELSQNSVFGNYYKNNFHFKEANSKNIIMTSPILSTDMTNTINILPVYNSYDEAMDLEKVNIVIEDDGMCYSSDALTIEKLIPEENGEIILEGKDSCTGNIEKTSITIEKIANLFKNKTELRGLYVRPLLDRYIIDTTGNIKLRDGFEKPYLKFTISGKKLANFYYKVAPLFAIFTNGGYTYDSSNMLLLFKDGTTADIEGKNLDNTNQVISFINTNRDIVKALAITIYFKPYIQSFKKDVTDNTYGFVVNTCVLSQFVGQLASWNKGFLNGNTYAKYDYNGNIFEDYYATKQELDELKLQIEELKNQIT